MCALDEQLPKGGDDAAAAAAAAAKQLLAAGVLELRVRNQAREPSSVAAIVFAASLPLTPAGGGVGRRLGGAGFGGIDAVTLLAHHRRHLLGGRRAVRAAATRRA